MSLNKTAKAGLIAAGVLAAAAGAALRLTVMVRARAAESHLVPFIPYTSGK